MEITGIELQQTAGAAYQRGEAYGRSDERKRLFELVQVERKQAKSYYPDDDSMRDGYCEALDFVLSTWKNQHD